MTATLDATGAQHGPVRLTSAYGFVNEYDATYFKPEGAIITNPVEIAILRERAAPIEDV